MTNTPLLTSCTLQLLREMCSGMLRFPPSYQSAESTLWGLIWGENKKIEQTLITLIQIIKLRNARLNPTSMSVYCLCTLCRQAEFYSYLTIVPTCLD